MGWKNGELLRLAEAEFDVFITIDKNLTAEKNLKNINLVLIVLVAVNNRIETLKLLVPNLQIILETIKAGDIICLK